MESNFKYEIPNFSKIALLILLIFERNMRIDVADQYGRLQIVNN